MADDLDAAADLTAAERDSMIDRARAAAARPGPAYTGSCRSCEEAVPEPKIFCDGDCADDWEKARRRRF